MTAFLNRRYIPPVKYRGADPGLVASHLRHLVADLFRPDIVEPDGIADAEPLMAGGLGLDSLDALELAINVEEIFGIAIRVGPGSTQAFSSVGNMASFICRHPLSRSAPTIPAGDRTAPSTRPERASPTGPLKIFYALARGAALRFPGFLESRPSR
jgi:acyl carrier protein